MRTHLPLSTRLGATLAAGALLFTAACGGSESAERSVEAFCAKGQTVMDNPDQIASDDYEAASKAFLDLASVAPAEIEADVKKLAELILVPGEEATVEQAGESLSLMMSVGEYWQNNCQTG